MEKEQAEHRSFIQALREYRKYKHEKQARIDKEYAMAEEARAHALASPYYSVN